MENFIYCRPVTRISSLRFILFARETRFANDRKVKSGWSEANKFPFKYGEIYLAKTSVIFQIVRNKSPVLHLLGLSTRSKTETSEKRLERKMRVY